MNYSREFDLGLHIICGLGGTRLTDEEEALLRNLRPIGIILFKHNFLADPGQSGTWVPHFTKLLDDVRSCCERDRIFVSIDHEGGKVNRLAPPVTAFPPARYWQKRSKEVGQAMGLELRALGINLNFAPVLDIDLEPSNTVIARRAFSDEAHSAAEYALEFMAGLEHSGVMACGKHFPGHGATKADSHFSLPTLEISKEDLCNRELIPFRSAIDAQISMLMTAHVRYPQIDPLLPATFSNTIIQGLLREELGFNGIVVSDALEMGALKDHNQSHALSSLIRAGADIALFANPSGDFPAALALRACEHTATELEKELLSPKTIYESQMRVKVALSRLDNLSSRAVAPTPDVLGCTSHKLLLNELV